MKPRYDIEHEEWLKTIRERLREEFGKDTFTEEELTREFWADYLIASGAWFKEDDGSTNMDAFWRSKPILLGGNQLSTEPI